MPASRQNMRAPVLALSVETPLILSGGRGCVALRKPKGRRNLTGLGTFHRIGQVARGRVFTKGAFDEV